VLPPPNQFFIEAAVGWLELGNPREALIELDQLDASLRNCAQALGVEWGIRAALSEWETALKIAKTLIEIDPANPSGWIHLGYSSRRVPGGTVLDAWNNLLSGAARFPREPIIAFNLACYACQMNRLDKARAWFHRATESGDRKEILKMGLAEKDLEPLWSEIKKL